ncbi:MAG TPA: SDR family oxidoreductase [Polyangia bacterium]|jgi:NAD(P)-dependent dehydrogenase (short-subunit alcohol dehydrogenase family)
MSIDIRGKWALVTGSSRGIGREIARGLAAKGCNLVLHGRAREHNASLADELGKVVQVAIVAAELSVEAEVDRMIHETQDLSGGIDVLYNNAAIMTPYRKDYTQVTSDDYRRSFEVNVIAAVRITHGLLPRMLERRFGRIVQVTSGIRNEPELMAYAASKAALDKFVRDTVIRLRDTGVTMNLLDPGWLRTDLGGPNAPNAVESVMPGALVPALVESAVQGTLFSAQEYAARA